MIMIRMKTDHSDHLELPNTVQKILLLTISRRYCRRVWSFGIIHYVVTARKQGSISLFIWKIFSVR